MTAAMRPTDPRDRLIVALDAPDVGEARAAGRADGEGARSSTRSAWSSPIAAACSLVSELASAGKQIFLDLKLHDIPNTVERATAQAAKLGASFLTVHAYPQTMRAAVAGAKGSGLKLLAVSVLTSSDDADLAEAGYAYGVSALVERRARQAIAAGIDGLVCSPAEAAKISVRRQRRRCCWSRPACDRPARRSATRSASRRRRRRSPTAPTTSSSAGRSRKTPTRAPPPTAIVAEIAAAGG